MTQNKKHHWENVYQTKQPDEVSWTQDVPATSINLLQSSNLAKDAAIIDVGGGDSNFVDFLISEGYSDITVLDISEKALERAKSRLGKVAGRVTWIVSDINQYRPDKQFDFWHDRAVFHFLTEESEVSSYQNKVSKFVKGFLAIGTFSESGPKKCSGLEIRQYSKAELSDAFSAGFVRINCFNEDHRTPFDTIQNFTFCFFRKSGDDQ